MRSGTVEGLQEVSFGSGSGVGRILQCREFAFVAQQLGRVPAFVAGFTAGERLLDGCQTSHDLTGLAETHRQLPKQQQEARQEPRIAGLFEPAAQSLQPAGKVAAPYDWKTARPMSAPCKMRRLEVLRAVFERLLYERLHAADNPLESQSRSTWSKAAASPIIVEPRSDPARSRTPLGIRHW